MYYQSLSALHGFVTFVFKISTFYQFFNRILKRLYCMISGGSTKYNLAYVVVWGGQSGVKDLQVSSHIFISVLNS